jgi:monothiol glutaredoxin
MSTTTLMDEIQREIADNKICIFGKGTKDIPRCGFTIETKEFFEKYGHPFTIIDVLDNMEKREALTQMTNWRTLPKVFINGKFYGDTDVLAPMEEKGELQAILKETFGE